MLRSASLRTNWGWGLRLGEPGTREAGVGLAGGAPFDSASLRSGRTGGAGCAQDVGGAPNHFEAVAKVQSVRGVHVSLSGLVPCCVIPGCVIPEGPVLPAPNSCNCSVEMAERSTSPVVAMPRRNSFRVSFRLAASRRLYSLHALSMLVKCQPLGVGYIPVGFPNAALRVLHRLTGPVVETIAVEEPRSCAVTILQRPR